jgi:hypothetical protein
MNVYYRICRSGEPIAAADSIEQARAIVQESHPGTFQILEVREDPQPNSHLRSRIWGQMIHPDDGPVILDPQARTPQEIRP